MFITDTQYIIYNTMVKFTYIPLQGITKRKCQQWGKYALWVLAYHREKKHARKSLLIEGNTLINGLMDRVMKFFKVGNRKEREEKHRLIYSTTWIMKP